MYFYPPPPPQQCLAESRRFDISIEYVYRILSIYMLKVEKHFTLVSTALSKRRYRFLVFSETSEYHCGPGTLLEITSRFLGSLVAQLVKNLPAMRKSWVRTLGWEDPLEMGKATHSSVLA